MEFRKKRAGILRNFNAVSGGESGLFDLLNFLRSGRMFPPEKGRDID